MSARRAPGPRERGQPGNAQEEPARSEARSLRADIEALVGTLGPDLEGLGFAVRHAAHVAGAPWRMHLLDDRRRVVAVVSLSHPLVPTLEARAARHAREAAARLPPELSRCIHQPLLCGEHRGRSYSVSRWRPPWPASGWARHTARFRTGPRVLGWLEDVVRATARPISRAETEGRLAPGLEAVAADGRLDETLRAAAGRALERVRAGLWRPRSVLCHNDLWVGNVLLGSRGASEAPFHVIDWATARLDGLPFWDLGRLLGSLHLPIRWQARCFRRHCEILECSPADALGAAVGAMGDLRLDLDTMPLEQFRSAVEVTWAGLRRIAERAGLGD
jgi:hypothetical protein